MAFYACVKILSSHSCNLTKEKGEDDLIYEADGVRVETSNDLLRVRHRHAAGEEMILKVCRGGEYLTVSVTLKAKK